MSTVAALGFLIAALATVNTAPALAYIQGEFPVEVCTAAVNYENHSWTFHTNNPTYIEAHTTCGESPTSGNPPTLANLSLGDTLGPGGVPVGTSGQWQFTAPPGTTIAEISGNDTLTKVGGNRAWNVYLATEDQEAHKQIAQTCTTTAEENECAAGGPFTIPGLNAQAITIGAECNAEEYAPGKTYTTCARGNEFGHAARAGLNSITVTLNDPNPPTNITASNIPTTPQHGPVTITGSATDTDAGLLSLSVINSSGETIAGPVSPGACNYSLLTPCPTTATELPLTINTETLPEGPNQIRIRATNAAHDETLSTTYTLPVTNHNPTNTNEVEPHKENTRGPTTVSTTTVTSAPPPTSSTTTTTGPHRPHLQIRLSELKIRHHVLSLSGSVASNIKSTLQLSIRARLRDGRHWATKITVPLHHSKFYFTVYLTHSLLYNRTTLELYFPGNSYYQATRLQRTLIRALIAA
jgi:hypothetical protein